jgi:hypothetical protein
MPKPIFDRTWFGGVSIDNTTHHDVLVVGENIIDRDNLIPGWFDNHPHHAVYDHELDTLFEEKPQIIIIGSGQSGVLIVPEDVKYRIKKQKIKLIVLETPEAIDEYNKLSKTKRVNALIHTTC